MKGCKLIEPSTPTLPLATVAKHLKQSQPSLGGKGEKVRMKRPPTISPGPRESAPSVASNDLLCVLAPSVA